MPRSRPATDPLSFHKHTGQYYVTRCRKRIYLGAEPDAALEEYHRLELGVPQTEPATTSTGRFITAKELTNRFITAQQANWRNPKATLRSYREWLGRFLKDHPGLIAADFTVEMLAAWKLSLRRRKYSAETINHFLGAVRAIFRFAEDTGLLEKAPRLTRVKNELRPVVGSCEKPLPTPGELRTLLGTADLQVRIMILLGLNCGFGPKDVHDLTWKDVEGERVTLPRSKTGICQTFLLWPETRKSLEELRSERAKLIERMSVRNRFRTDSGHVFVTKFWRPWSKDAVSHEFRKLCDSVGIPCYGFYRLRHCASTAMSLVTNPHVHRRFMRHSQLQQQVTYTHTPDSEVDAAINKARLKLLGTPTGDSESSPEQEEVA